MKKKPVATRTTRPAGRGNFPTRARARGQPVTVTRTGHQTRDFP
jgi:hypothetical protein